MRKTYPTDLSDEEWSYIESPICPHLTHPDNPGCTPCVPLTFHHSLRAECSQQEGMSEHQWLLKIVDASGSGDGESG